MNKIYKYKLENVDRQTIEIRLPARILSVIEYDDDIVLYSIVDDDNNIPTISVDILVVGTGDIVEDNIGLYIFLGTVKLFDNKEIWHVFYRYHNRDETNRYKTSQDKTNMIPIIEELNEKTVKGDMLVA